jgi:probable HAF family extracellular repeat protein
MLANERTVRRTIMARHARLHICFLVCALLGPATALALPSYQATFLPSGFAGQDINNAGQIVGNTRESEAWIWSDSGIVNLSLLVPGVQAFAINNRGDVAGNYGPGDTSAFIYSNGTFRDIGRVSGLNYATPRAINDEGQVAGTAGNFPGDTSRPFFYDGATMVGIGTFGGDQGDALALDDEGTVVGNAALAPPPDSPYGARQPFIYRNGTLSELRASQAMIYSANDINDTGAIIGSAAFPETGLGQPYVYTGGVIRSLGGPGGDALGINDAGDIVGVWPSFDDLQYRAFVYRDGKLAGLNDLVLLQPGWTITRADDINDAGQILATACFGSAFDCRSVRLDLIPAVPEPANLAMFAGGLLTLAMARRRRR